MIPCNHAQEVREHAEDEASAELRAIERNNRVESMAQALMQPGRLCDPFEPENFQEALANMGSEDAKTLAGKAELLDCAVTNNLKQTAVMQQAMFTAVVLCLVREYWLKTARHLAEKDAPL